MISQVDFWCFLWLYIRRKWYVYVYPITYAHGLQCVSVSCIVVLRDATHIVQYGICDTGATI